MNRQQKDLFLMDEDEIYAEAQRRILECREKGLKRLDFSCLHLTKIPPEIAELETLAELDICDIEMKKIPGFIGNIASLKKLSLGSAYSGRYEGGNIALPSQLGKLRNLQNLFLGYGISGIPKWVFGLENLEALSIFSNTAETIPEEIAGMKKLRKLRVYGGNITSLPPEIGKQLELTVLDLECPKLGALPGSFANLKKMICIRLASDTLFFVPGFICGWTELEELEICMAFHGPYTTSETIPKNIGNLRKLKHLNLAGAGIAKIPDSLGHCPLRHLSFTGGFKTIPAGFGNLANLETLQLRSTKPLTLPDSFGNLCRLKELSIHAPALEITSSLGNLTALKKLEIHTEKDPVLPETFGGLAALKKFLIEAREMCAIPDSIGECKNLKDFYLDSDKITKLPESFCKLKKLEELHLDTFTLKELPANFGSLAALKSLRIFSGSLIVLPESMGKLKNLKYLSIDAFNVNKLPASFKMLSYVKKPDIKISSEEPERKRGTVSFGDLVKMNYRYCWKFLESLSLKQLESLLRSAPLRSTASENEKEVFKWIMQERSRRLNRKFKWTDENKKRIVKVSDAFLKAWEDGSAKAKKMVEALNPRDDECTIEIVLYPDIANFKEDEISMSRMYGTITDHLNSELELSMRFSYDTLAKNEDRLRESIHVRRKLSWNTEGLGDYELEDSYICYALHILYSHNNWAIEDIAKIDNITTEIKIDCNSGDF
jgi:Leucine-rich repeat (LRR) protein